MGASSTSSVGFIKNMKKPSAKGRRCFSFSTFDGFRRISWSGRTSSSRSSLSTRSPGSLNSWNDYDMSSNSTMSLVTHASNDESTSSFSRFFDLTKVKLQIFVDTQRRKSCLLAADAVFSDRFTLPMGLSEDKTELDHLRRLNAEAAAAASAASVQKTVGDDCTS